MVVNQNKMVVNQNNSSSKIMTLVFRVRRVLWHRGTSRITLQTENGGSASRFLLKVHTTIEEGKRSSGLASGRDLCFTATTSAPNTDVSPNLLTASLTTSKSVRS